MKIGGNMELLRVRKYKNRVCEEKKDVKESNAWRRRIKTID